MIAAFLHYGQEEGREGLEREGMERKRDYGGREGGRSLIVLTSKTMAECCYMMYD